MRSLWAKSDGPQGHGLLAHMLDVAAVAERILAREPQASLQWAANAFGIPVPRLGRWLAWVAGQHDVGKGTIGFQNKWPDGRARDAATGLIFDPRLMTYDRHDLSSAVLLAQRLSPVLARVVAAHHGFHFQTMEIRNARQTREPAAWTQARDVLLQHYDRVLLGPDVLPESGAGAPAPAVADAAIRTDVSTDVSTDDLAALNWLAGLTSVADWIGSNTDWFAPGERAATLHEHHAGALVLADRALDDIGWPQVQALPPESPGALLERITGVSGVQPRPLQTAADELLQGVAAPALLIVEAPMGEGKTELAFMAYLHLQRQLGHRGFYIGLPTQATGNAMFERAWRFLQAVQLFTTRPGSSDADADAAGEGTAALHDPERILPALDLQLAHGGAALERDRLIELRGIHADASHAPGGHAGEAVQCSSWFAQRRRALLSPFGVGTIDQALYATLNVKHHFVRLWGLANRVVVLDEVHAYDSYTGGLIEALLRWLQRLGCSVILMSATLPAARRRALLSAWGVEAEAVAQDAAPAYPRLLLASGGRLAGRHCPSRPMAPIRLGGIDERVESIAALALEQVAPGGCIAIIVNTVDRAQQLWRLLRPQLAAEVPVLLFHARFPADERSQRERAVQALYGKAGTRPARALLIATQVAEQSLDIDFDLLISDLAPVDLLLQRAGRLHRHVRQRPAAHAEPRLIVAGLLPAALPDLKRTGWAAVYGAYLLGRTWAFASREERWTLPHDIDRLVQQIYGDEPLPPATPAAARDFIEGEAWGEHRAEAQQMEQFAANAAIDVRDALQDAYSGKPHGREAGEGLGADNRTRFGAESITLIPVHQDSTDAGRWRLLPDEAPFDPACKPDPALARRLVCRQVRLSRMAVVKALQATEPPAGWADHPWLRDLRPLLLQDGCWRHGALCVRLDADLGIVYTTEPKQDKEAAA
ncbi:MAG: CRISPR-associated helicase Cas3' [Burkholderiaceae bacterium]|nr:CRISPR-associated helicase Cas3' [Burkholderiaceae bacterium]